MTKDILFTLVGNFMHGMDGPLYWPECAILEGLLTYFPEVRQEIDVRTIEFNRPRPDIIKVLGEENQGCPCLVLADPAKADGLPVKSFGEHSFLDDDKAIIEYLARHYGVSRPAHD